MLFPEASKAIADSIVMMAQIQGVSVVEYIEADPAVRPRGAIPASDGSRRRVGTGGPGALPHR
jgi:hypothetical protein